MAEPKRALAAPLEEPGLDLSEFTQEIEEPLADVWSARNEPTLTRLDFEEIELALDWLPR